jgi:plasmid maintenance system antidote protein VapI
MELDKDKIREELSKFLEDHSSGSGSHWAGRMGVTHVTMYNFLNGARNTSRQTLIKIKLFLNEWKEKYGTRS